MGLLCWELRFRINQGKNRPCLVQIEPESKRRRIAPSVQDPEKPVFSDDDMLGIENWSSGGEEEEEDVGAVVGMYLSMASIHGSMHVLS